MQTRASKATVHAFTLLEALVVIAIIAILMGIALPMLSRPKASPLLGCLRAQKQIAIAERIFAEDHAGKFQWETSITNGGTLEITGKADAAVQFSPLSDEIGSLRTLICPTDSTRSPATNLASLNNSNVSYFINLSAVTNNPQRVLSGDRHLQIDGKPVMPGLLSVASNATVTWTSELHKKSKSPVGNLSFSDGHAETVREKLDSYFKGENSVTNQLVIP